MPRKIVLAANWKMNLTLAESQLLVENILTRLEGTETCEIILFPSFLHIPMIAEKVKGKKIGLGGQNLYFEEKGAYTGEVAAFQLVDAGCTHVLIGHSERRHYFLEDYVDQIVSAMQNITLNNLTGISIAYEPIWAIGTGRNATPKDAAHVHHIIRKTLSRIFNQDVADGMSILYGGSVKPDNIADLMAEGDIDGALVGGASLKSESFLGLLRCLK
jgi:triosephosphate isomerase